MVIRAKKQELKAMAASIKLNRFWYKHGQRTGDYSKMTMRSWELAYLTIKFRYEHLAYCIARGRVYEQCEPKVREGNEIDQAKLAAMVLVLTTAREKEVLDAAAEVVCAG